MTTEVGISTTKDGPSRLDKLFPDRKSPALHFQVVATEKGARASILDLPHATVNTPIFMPVGTQGTIKGLTTEQVHGLNCRIILGNTYHLGLRPGPDTLAEMNGLHTFENWHHNLLTDSGGFQMVSLLALAEFSEEGVNFQSPHDGSEMLLTPELSMHIQNQIGADIMMALDDVVSSKVTGPRVKEACERTLRWIDRCMAAHKRPKEQNLFGIVQGGLDPELRHFCLDGLLARDLPGYAIGGLSGGESKDQFWRMVHLCAQRLPADKPRYVMGVGYPVDMVVCVALGCDMFDCVYPTRTGRFGTALVRGGLLNLRSREAMTDFGPIDPDCDCTACTDYTRSYLNTLITSRQQTGSILISLHNIAHQLRLMKDVRQAIAEGRFHQFIIDFMRLHYPTPDQYPTWVIEALDAANFPLPDAQR